MVHVQAHSCDNDASKCWHLAYKPTGILCDLLCFIRHTHLPLHDFKGLFGYLLCSRLGLAACHSRNDHLQLEEASL